MDMIKYHITESNPVIAELQDNDFIINDAQDALELMAALWEYDCRRIIVHKENLNDIFFDLKTGLAGDVLQKFSNYDVRLAIIGDFSEFSSKSLQDFIRECNQRKKILFLEDIDSALEMLRNLK